MKAPAKTRKITLAGRKRPARGWIARSVTEAMGFVRLGKTVTASGEYGTLLIYRNDGPWRAFFTGVGGSTNYLSFTVKGVHGWLKEWWPKLGDVT